MKGTLRIRAVHILCHGMITVRYPGLRATSRMRSYLPTSLPVAHEYTDSNDLCRVNGEAHWVRDYESSARYINERLMIERQRLDSIKENCSGTSDWPLAFFFFGNGDSYCCHSKIAKTESVGDLDSKMLATCR